MNHHDLGTVLAVVIIALNSVFLAAGTAGTLVAIANLVVAAAYVAAKAAAVARVAAVH